MSSLKLSLLGGAAILALGASPSSASFVGVFHENLSSGNNVLFVFGAEGTNGRIRGNDGLDLSFTIDNTGVFEQNFGLRGRELTTSGAVSNLSFSVSSDDPISGLALNRATATTDMTTLLDEGSLGTRYRVLTTPGVFGSGSQMSVTATADNTLVTVTSPISIDGNAADTPFQITLNKGESVFYELGSGRDLSGSTISASAPVAVFAGAECTQVPVGLPACDHLISQQFSVDDFDTRFKIASNFGGGADGDLVRVIADTDGTEVFLNGELKGIIDAGGVLELPNVTSGIVTASQPVSVGQFVRGQEGTRDVGDPAFAIIPSIDQELKEYAYATPTGTDAFNVNYLNIAIDDMIAASLMLNGASVDTSGFSMLDGLLFGNVPIEVGFGTISASDSFLATISGFSNADSYFTPIATAFSAGVSPPPPPPPPPSVVPLPAAGWLLVAGIAGLGAFRRKRG